jgi:putative flippase GtrA
LSDHFPGNPQPAFKDIGGPLATITVMSTAVAPHRRPEPASARPMVDIVIPVYNEAGTLGASIARLHRHLTTSFPFTWRITIADNASTDATWSEAATLAALFAGIRLVHIDQKGRGGALRAAWESSDADVVAYMDVDLSTDLAALLPLVAPLLSGHSDVAIGSRLAVGSHTIRGPKREFISRCYNRLIHLVFRNGFRDAQCGFKAVRADVARRLLPAIEDQTWFFDTELLLLAEHNGLRIAEVPVDWTDDLDSRVHIASTAADDLKGLARMAWRLWTGRGAIDFGDIERRTVPAGTGGELVTFAIVGALSTVATLVMFLVLRGAIGSIAANATAFTVAGLGNIAANRRWTFGRHGRSGRRGEWLRSTGIHLAGLAITTGALLLARVIEGGSLAVELSLLAVAFTVSTALRFLLMPAWIFRRRAARSFAFPSCSTNASETPS